MRLNRLFFALILLAVVSAPAYGDGVSVIVSDDSSSVREVLAGFKEAIRHRIVDEHNVRDGALPTQRLDETEEPAPPDLFFAIGAPALEAVLARSRELPVVYSMVPDPTRIVSSGAENVAGVDMQVPLTRVVEVLSSLQPPVRRLGVLSNSLGAKNDAKSSVAEAQGVRLVPVTASSPRDVSRALKSLAGKIDVLWIGDDQAILAPEVMEYILLWSYENRVPVVGVSADHTRKGALFSLSSGNGREMGREAGELANRILEGEPSPSIALDAELTVNLKAAQKLGFTIPDGILERARNLVQAPVYEEGDWWIFRVKRKDKPPESYRVTYTNGKFESDDPDFLKVSENRDSISWLPLISVHSEGPKKRWFEFPLVPGKEWSFDYGHTHASRLTMVATDWAATKRAWRLVETRVKGLVKAPVEAPAGKFEAVEIRRLVEVPGRAAQEDYEFTYFYSSLTKSAVKLLAKGRAYLGVGEWAEFGYTMQLVAYGNRHIPPPHDRIARTRAEPALTRAPPMPIDWDSIEAPVYQEGDWWVFRVRHGKRVEKYRVTYRNGKFQSDDPTFLLGSANSVSLTWLPLVSVNLNDQERKWFDFPLVAGKEWKFGYQAGATTHVGRYGFRGSVNLELRARRESVAHVNAKFPQSVATPAGKFETILIERQDSWVTDVEFKYFYSPKTRSVVKLSAQIVDNEFIREPYELELIDYGRPGYGTQHSEVVKAPVYREGDWWVFRVSIDGLSEEHRIEYKDGRFESDDMTFLNGEAREFLPWATVNIHDPERQWLSFPITAGSQWKFRYEATSPISSYPTVFNAEAEVVGSEPVSVETQAGQFVTFEISRLDRASGRKPWGTLTYFYSPDVKSIVKLSGKHYRGTITGGYYARTYFELELMDYHVTEGTASESFGRSSTTK